MCLPFTLDTKTLDTKNPDTNNLDTKTMDTKIWTPKLWIPNPDTTTLDTKTLDTKTLVTEPLDTKTLNNNRRKIQGPFSWFSCMGVGDLTAIRFCVKLSPTYLLGTRNAHDEVRASKRSCRSP
jgi:hypothetical protein